MKSDVRLHYLLYECVQCFSKNVVVRIILERQAAQATAVHAASAFNIVENIIPRNLS